MEIILGKRAGFCGGVINSVTKSNELLDKYRHLYCLGEIVHNKVVVHHLEEKGMIFINSLSEVENGSKVVIRAHGVPKEIYEEAKNRNIELFDLTCPKVLLIHKEAENLVNDGFYVLVIGKKDHPEIIGTISYCNKDSMIIEDVADVDQAIEYIKNNRKKKVAILSQTTYSVSKFHEIEELFKEKLSDVDLNIINTICNATELRQQETDEISRNVDAMIIIGGKNSSNTKKLFEVSEKNTITFIIETVSDLDQEIFTYGKVGVMAGASTPKESIDEVLDFLNKN